MSFFCIMKSSMLLVAYYSLTSFYSVYFQMSLLAYYALNFDHKLSLFCMFSIYPYFWGLIFVLLFRGAKLAIFQKLLVVVLNKKVVAQMIQRSLIFISLNDQIIFQNYIYSNSKSVYLIDILNRMCTICTDKLVNKTGRKLAFAYISTILQ